MKKCLIIADFLSDENRKMINTTAEQLGYSAFFYDDYHQSADGDIADAEILYTADYRAVQKAQKLKWCHTPYAGVDKLISTGVFDSGDVILTNSSGAYGRAISEYIIMASLMLMKQMPEYRKMTDNRCWAQDLPSRSIAGSMIAVIGTGDIGRNAAKRFKALGADSVIGFSRSGRPADDFDHTYSLDAFEDNVRDIDVLVMCVPGTPETDKLLSAERISCLPEKAFLINVGRGTTVDQDALIEALNEGRIAGAMLDVVMPEPLPADHPLWTARNCIVTPHIAGDMSLPYTVDRTVEFFCENLKIYAEGGQMLHRVEISAGY